MAIVAELTMPSGEFLLGQTLGERPDVTVRVERMVTDGSQRVTPYFWAVGSDLDDLEAHLNEDPTLSCLDRLEEHGDERLYRGVWRGTDSALVEALDCAEATVLEATGVDGNWDLRIMFADQDALSAFHDRCRSAEITFDLDRLYGSEAPSEFGKFAVTDEQREALVTAHDLGYFRVPREVTLQDVADELGVSRNAVSARLRRGIDELVGHTLAHDAEPDEEADP